MSVIGKFKRRELLVPNFLDLAFWNLYQKCDKRLMGGIIWDIFILQKTRFMFFNSLCVSPM